MLIGLMVYFLMTSLGELAAICRFPVRLPLTVRTMLKRALLRAGLELLVQLGGDYCR